MEEIEKGKTHKYLRDTQGVPDKAKEQLKEFSRIKKSIVEALRDDELTIAQITEKIGLSRSKTMYYLMTLVKYGVVAVGQIDDMDEYFTYKLKK